MNDMNLRVEPEFEKLIYPVPDEAVQALTEKLKAEGCKEPVTVWDGMILDGHKRFAVCTEYGIPYETREAFVRNDQEAIIWICKEQLKRKDLPAGMRRYLIGCQFKPLKEIYWAESGEAEESAYDRAIMQIASENGITSTTVRRYSAYVKAIDAIREKAPYMVWKVLSGEIEIGHDNLLILAERSPDELKMLYDRWVDDMRVERLNQKKREHYNTRPVDLNAPSVKDPPVYDPNSEVVSLIFTIPMWLRTMDLTAVQVDWAAVSAEVKQKLENDLHSLEACIDEFCSNMSMCDAEEGDTHGYE